MDVSKTVFRNDIDGLAKAIAESPEGIDERDQDLRTPLMHAAIDSNESAAQVLIQGGAAVNATDKMGFSALSYASQSYSPNIVAMLLSNGAKVDNVDEHGNTPLFRAVFNSKGRPEVIRLLLEAGADKNLKNKHGVSPYELAGSIANFDINTFFNE